MTLVLRWYWQHRHLYVAEHDSLAEAIGAVFGGLDSGLEAVDCIEMWEGGNYHRIFADEAAEMATKLYDDTPRAEPSPSRWKALVRIQSPDGEWTEEYSPARRRRPIGSAASAHSWVQIE